MRKLKTFGKKEIFIVHFAEKVQVVIPSNVSLESVRCARCIRGTRSRLK